MNPNRISVSTEQLSALFGESVRNSLHLLIALTLGFVICATGCQRHRPQISDPISSTTITKSVNQLATISVDSRQLISHPEISGVAGGSPVVEDFSTQIRTIDFAAVQSKAAENSALANAIVDERQKLCCNDNVPKCLPTILDLQAQHERNQSAGQAGVAFLNLVQIYLQHDVLVASTKEVDRAAAIVKKLKDADVPLEFDDRRFEREHNKLEEKAVDLLYNQKRLTTGLSLLLDLDEKDVTPIWTEYQSEGLPEPVELNSALETAWTNRTDLQALSLLADCCDADLLEIIRSSAKSLHPLLGLSMKRKRLFRRLFSKVDETREACCRVDQVRALIEARKKLISQEISDLVFSMDKRRRLITLKKETINSLQKSITAAEKAAVIKPVDFETEMANKAKILETRSELISEVIGLEIDGLKLKQAQGLLK